MRARRGIGALAGWFASARSILTLSQASTTAARLPKRVADLIQAQEADSERLIGWVQFGIIATFAMLYLVSPHPADAPMAMRAPVPIAIVAYGTFTVLRLAIAYRRQPPGWLLGASIFADTMLLLGLIWSFHYQYAQPPGFSLKVPTFIYIFVFIAIRALRFDHRYVLTAGLTAAAGWMLLVALAVHASPDGTVTPQLRRVCDGQRHSDRRRTRQDLHHPDGDGRAHAHCATRAANSCHRHPRGGRRPRGASVPVARCRRRHRSSGHRDRGRRGRRA